MERAENNEKKVEYLEDNIQDTVLQAGLALSYSMFKVCIENLHVTHLLCTCTCVCADLKMCDLQLCLFIVQFFNGTFNSINHQFGLEGLKSRMEKFFKRVSA